MNPLFTLKYSKAHEAFLIGIHKRPIKLMVQHAIGFYGLRFSLPIHLRLTLLDFIDSRMR